MKLSYRHDVGSIVNNIDNPDCSYGLVIKSTDEYATVAWSNSKIIVYHWADIVPIDCTRHSTFDKIWTSFWNERLTNK